MLGKGRLSAGFNVDSLDTQIPPLICHDLLQDDLTDADLIYDVFSLMASPLEDLWPASP
jgi:hypothetical protein